MRSAAAARRYGITLLELGAIWRMIRKARMTDDPKLRSLAKQAAERGARELLRLASLVDEEPIGRRFASTHDGTCSACGGPIVAGDVIAWLPKTAICSACVSGAESMQ